MNLLTKKQFVKDWGKKCKDFAPLCVCCIAWHAYETLCDLYDIERAKKSYPSHRLMKDYKNNIK